MSGSIRQPGAASWEVRVYAGIDPHTGKPRYRTATVHGNRADAERGLERLVAEVSSVKALGSSSTVSELLEAWFAIASLSWAPTTIRQTRSVLDAGIPLPVVSRRLDHQRASTTLNVYAHAVPGRDAPAAELLHQIFHHQATKATEPTGPPSR
jgi:hypothetical protein